jgi:hypothetical protein
VILSLLCGNFIQKILNSGDGPPNVPMVALPDMLCQIN